MTLLYRIAGRATLGADPAHGEHLAWLLARDLIRKVEPPRIVGLEQQYEALQERHQRFTEVKAALDRLRRRMEPRVRLGGLLPSHRPSPPGHEDPDIQIIYQNLDPLGIRPRDVEHPRDVGSRLEKIRERLSMDDRECLDRMATLDRELNAARNLPQAGTLVEPEGYFALTEAGARELPEAPVLEALEGAFNAVSGPRRHKIEDYAHFRHDPGNLLMFVLENPTEADTLAELVATFEALAEAFERHAFYTDIRSTRIRNAFLMRLLLAHRGNARQAFHWCNRERIHGLLAQMRSLLPRILGERDTVFLHALDLFLVGEQGPPAELRMGIFRRTDQLLTLALGATRIKESQFARLCLAFTCGALERNFTSPALLDRFLHNRIEVTMEARGHAPPDLHGEGARLLFGFHLAHLAGFLSSRLPDQVDRYRMLEGPFLGSEAHARKAPIQVVLHGRLAQERLEQGGIRVEAEDYAHTYFRIHHWIMSHKEVSRWFQVEPVGVDESFQAMRGGLGRHAFQGLDSAYLAAHLTARTYFQDLSELAEMKRVPDAGMAAAYEHPERRRPPLLGLPFGTLMLQ